MFIEYKTVNNIEYASVTSSVRVKGKVIKDGRTNLGRVIDKEKGSKQKFRLKAKFYC